ncbi:hypothetical protein C8J56DRAFT_1027736 [Mycena floridula]|nr:hypothetical protein C8J56DRAFT_1027736 [Mycena floridula]
MPVDSMKNRVQGLIGSIYGHCFGCKLTRKYYDHVPETSITALSTLGGMGSLVSSSATEAQVGKFSGDWRMSKSLSIMLHTSFRDSGNPESPNPELTSLSIVHQRQLYCGEDTASLGRLGPVWGTWKYARASLASNESRMERFDGELREKLGAPHCSARRYPLLSLVAGPGPPACLPVRKPLTIRMDRAQAEAAGSQRADLAGSSNSFRFEAYVPVDPSQPKVHRSRGRPKASSSTPLPVPSEKPQRRVGRPPGQGLSGQKLEKAKYYM